MLWATSAAAGAAVAALRARVREDLVKTVGISRLPCNWLQCAENSVDPIHLEHLHLRFTNWVRKRRGESPILERKHARIDFEIFDYGILKKRLWEGDAETVEEWRVGHPIVFPGTLFVPINHKWVEWQFRVPVDDTNTIIYWYDAKQPEPGHRSHRSCRCPRTRGAPPTASSCRRRSTSKT